MNATNPEAYVLIFIRPEACQSFVKTQKDGYDVQASNNDQPEIKLVTFW